MPFSAPLAGSGAAGTGTEGCNDYNKLILFIFYDQSVAGTGRDPLKKNRLFFTVAISANINYAEEGFELR